VSAEVLKRAKGPQRALDAKLSSASNTSKVTDGTDIESLVFQATPEQMARRVTKPVRRSRAGDATVSAI
jgi:hypothetical protein